jgi:hypothetical protein
LKGSLSALPHEHECSLEHRGSLTDASGSNVDLGGHQHCRSWVEDANRLLGEGDGLIDTISQGGASCEFDERRRITEGDLEGSGDRHRSLEQ